MDSKKLDDRDEFPPIGSSRGKAVERHNVPEQTIRSEDERNVSANRSPTPGVLSTSEACESHSNSPVSHGPRHDTSVCPPSQAESSSSGSSRRGTGVYQPQVFLFPHGYEPSQMAYIQFPPRAPSWVPRMSDGPRLSPDQMHSSMPYYRPVSRGPQQVTSARPPSQDYVDANNFNAIPQAMYNDNSPFLSPHGYGRSQMAYRQIPPQASFGCPFPIMSGGPWLSPDQMHSSMPYYRPVSRGPHQVNSARPPSQHYVDDNNFNAIPGAMYNDNSPFLIPPGYGRFQMTYEQVPPRAPFLYPFPIMSEGPWLPPHPMYSRPSYYGPISRGPEHVTSARPPSQAELFPSESHGLGCQTGSLDTSKPASSQNVHPQPQGRHRSGEQSVPQRYEYDEIKEPRASKPKGKSSASGDRVVESTSWYSTDCNFPNFKTDYERAKFFVIKSYNKENIHRSIRCHNWASTELGNSIMDAAYRKANQGEGICPVFLFFSVDTIGKFVGVAEMVGPVDFGNIDDYWKGYGWNGQFPVKWHIISGVPSYLLKDIVLQNNGGMPVTYSQNAQEVELRQGIRMLEIFKNYGEEQIDQLADQLGDTLKPKSGDDFKLFN